MSSLLKALLDKRLSMSMEDEQKDPETNGTEETVPKGDDKAAVGDGGSTPDGSEASSEEENEQAGAGEGEAAGAAEGTEGGEATEGAEGGEGTEGAEASEGGEGGEAAGGDDEGGVEFEDEDEDDDEDEFEEEEFEETSDALSETQKADLALVNLITNVRETLADGGLTGREAAMVADRAGAILGKIEMEPSPTPAQECFGSFGDRRNNTELTLEALEEDKRAVEEKKSGLIERIMKFIRELWNSLFGNKERFKQQVVQATSTAVKLDSKQTVTLKGKEGMVAAFAAIVGKDQFTAAELNMGIAALGREVGGLVTKFTTVAGNDEVDPELVSGFVEGSKILVNLGMNSSEYTERTKEYAGGEISIDVDGAQAKALVTTFDNNFKHAENYMRQVEGVAKKACASGNNKQLEEVLTIVRMFTNLTKSGPLLAIRLAVKEDEAA